MSLSLRLGDDTITNIVSNIQIKSVSPGGFASVTFDVKRQLEQSLFETFTDCLVFDETTGEQVGGGRLMEQGRNDDGSWQVTCLGEGLASMQDRTEPYMLIDSGDEQWELRLRNTKKLEVGQGQTPTSAAYEGLFLEADEDTIVYNGSYAIMAHRGAVLCGQLLGSLGFVFNSGQTDSDWFVEPRAYSSDLSASTLLSGSAGYQWTGTSTSTRKLFVAGTDIPSTRPVAGIRWLRDGSDDTAVESTWNIVRNLIVQTRRLDSNRTPITGATYASEAVQLFQAFIDVVARFCPRLDIENATVPPTTSHFFDQLMWLSGISPMGVMEEMLRVESGYTWHVWERAGSGRWTTELVPKPTKIRYEATVGGGFSSPAPTTEVYNWASVTWTSPMGRPQTTVVTSYVPALAEAGIVRSTTIALGTETGSYANAVKAGTDFLAEHSVPPNAGTLTIPAGTRIRDNFTGRYVRPWHIRTNELIRVSGVQPTPNTLNADSPDGVTVFRVVSNHYSVDNAASVLELDEFELTESRAIAQLTRARH